jgi:serine/threonine-protein kinase
MQVYDVGEAGGLPFLTLELVEGGGLDRKLAGTPLPPAEAAALVETLAGAVAAATRPGWSTAT